MLCVNIARVMEPGMFNTVRKVITSFADCAPDRSRLFSNRWNGVCAFKSFSPLEIACKREEEIT